MKKVFLIVGVIILSSFMLLVSPVASAVLSEECWVSLTALDLQMKAFNKEDKALIANYGELSKAKNIGDKPIIKQLSLFQKRSKTLLSSAKVLNKISKKVRAVCKSI